MSAFHDAFHSKASMSRLLAFTIVIVNLYASAVSMSMSGTWTFPDIPDGWILLACAFYGLNTVPAAIQKAVTK